ncbi:MAG: tRNA (adenosine(37)-N6)-threonylcarbamoyltransferase complex transferase subunit TsaD [Eubacteriales Family XIII. Incertae Sedis bacterium]|nr:MAG: tRNA (adenosine(37)-N6)-threonylcarbamoyltransferase complex transferase subunit TsaD [Clostridiales Family XIII bacterium]
MKDGKFLTIAFESSCDETSVAVTADGREVLANVISTQIEIHKLYGGVVPEIASRHHLENINAVTEQALSEAGVTWDEIDLIGVTKGPGLVGALLIGVATAKAFALAKNKPLVGVHHIQGHISANYIVNKELEPPFTALIISGGHTTIAKVTDYNECEVLGQTRDDAAGEAFDKVARVIGLGYPGGPLIDKLAKEGNPHAVEFKRVYLEKDSLDFSFSGIKTGVLNYINSEKQAGREIVAADIAASFQQAVLDVVVDKAISAAKCGSGESKAKLAVAGGVAANSELRRRLQAAGAENGVAVFCPPPVLCTDNAAMIACAAYYAYSAGAEDDLSLDAYASLPL